MQSRGGVAPLGPMNLPSGECATRDAELGVGLQLAPQDIAAELPIQKPPVLADQVTRLLRGLVQALNPEPLQPGTAPAGFLGHTDPLATPIPWTHRR